MKNARLPFVILVSSANIVLGVPQEIGLMGGLQADNRDLTNEFIAPDPWRPGGVLPGHWSNPVEAGERRFVSITKAPTLFGQRPIGVEACYVANQLDRVSIYYLEVGSFFGYQPDLKGSESGQRQLRSKEHDFRKAYDATLASLAKHLRDMTDSRGQPRSDGRTQLLKTRFQEFEHENVAIQLRGKERFYVRVDLRRKGDESSAYLDDQTARRSRRDRAAGFRNNVSKSKNGDVTIRGVPMVGQGNRAYCGVTTFLMVARYLGSQLDPATLASASGFRFGMGGKKMIEAYGAAADEGQFQLRRDQKLDFERVKQAIDAGMPVLVWRRFDFGRDRLHAGQAPPEPTAADRATWPSLGDANHASVVVGYNVERRELIFDDSWGEHARGKRMKAEELEATTYYTFYSQI